MRARRPAESRDAPVGDPPPPGSNRLDQWLWFARFTKSRSIAARLCAAGAITINGAPVGKANRLVRLGDLLTLPQGRYRRSVRVLAFALRRGPASEASGLYEEAGPPSLLSAGEPDWTPLLEDDPE